MKTWTWYLPTLTKEHAAKLQTALLSRFRFNLQLAVLTVGWQPRKQMFWVKLPKNTLHQDELLNNVGNFINGYYSAIKS